MFNLIINADDLGYSKEINIAIEKAIVAGAITSSSLLVNAPAFEDGVEIAQKYPGISIGLHLDLIEFMPLTNPEVFKKYGIVGSNGYFIEKAIFNVVDFTEELKNAIEEEWCAQAEKFISAGLVITHIDSHQHTHLIYALKDVLSRVMNRYSIKKVRRPLSSGYLLMLCAKFFPKTTIYWKAKPNAVKPASKPRLIRYLNLFIHSFHVFYWLRHMKSEYCVPDYFYSYLPFYERSNILCIQSDSTVELECHPGYEETEVETVLLMQKNLEQRYQYRLISYNDLCK